MSFSDGFRECIIVLMIDLRQDAFLAAGVLQGLPARRLFVDRCPITIVLLKAEVSQRFVAEEIFACVVEKEMRIWVFRVTLDVEVSARSPRRALWHKFSRRPNDRASRADDMKPEESIMSHAQAECPAFEEVAHPALLLGLQVIPLGIVFTAQFS